MSTRGLYKFGNSDFNTLMYVHCDNYPEGSAEKFLNMINIDNSYGGNPIKFIRGNDRVEIIDCDNCGQEYTYTLVGNKVRCVHNTYDKGDNCIFDGDILAFINKYIDIDRNPNFEYLFWFQFEKYANPIALSLPLAQLKIESMVNKMRIAASNNDIKEARKLDENLKIVIPQFNANIEVLGLMRPIPARVNNPDVIETQNNNNNNNIVRFPGK